MCVTVSRANYKDTRLYSGIVRENYTTTRGSEATDTMRLNSSQWIWGLAWVGSLRRT